MTPNVLLRSVYSTGTVLTSIETSSLHRVMSESQDRREPRFEAERRVDDEARSADIDREAAHVLRPLVREDLGIQMHGVPLAASAALGEAPTAKALFADALDDPRVREAGELPQRRLRPFAMEVRLQHHRRTRGECLARACVQRRVGHLAEHARALAVAGAELVGQRLLEIVLREDRDAELASQPSGERRLTGPRRAG